MKLKNLPNILTISRIVMIPIFVLFFYLNFTGHYFVALGIFCVASITDFFDGYIARKYNFVSNFGKFLDPIADKVLVLSAFIIFLTAPEIFTANCGNWAVIVAGCGVAIILAREIIVSGLRMVAASSGFVIAADIFGKYKTFTQDICVIVLLVGAGMYEFVDNIACTVVNLVGLSFFIISIILTVISGINYLVKNIDALKK